jgi:hypothetical protein
MAEFSDADMGIAPPGVRELSDAEMGIISPGTPQAGAMTHSPGRPPFLAQASGALKAPTAEGGLDDFGLRADLSVADTFKEKLGKFQTKYPTGDLRAVETTGLIGRPVVTLMFRRTEGDPYREIDPNMVTSGPELADVADLLGDVPSIAGEVLATARYRGANLIPLLARIFFGSTAGELAKEGVEVVRGTSDETPEEVGTRALMQGAGSAAGAGATVPLISGPVNFARGVGALKIGDEGREMMAAAERQGLPVPRPDQVTDNPLIRRLGQQASATVPSMARYAAEQNKTALANFSGALDPGATAMLPLRAKAAHDAARNDAIEKGRRAIRAGNADRGGAALTQGIEEYDKIARTAVDDLYNSARSLHDPEFDLSDVQSLAGEFRQGVVGAGREEGSFINVRGNLPPEMEAVIGDVLALRPDVRSVTTPDGRAISAFDQVKELRGRLFDLTQPPSGMPARQEHLLARRLYGALSDALDNPVGGPPEFRAAWREASTEAARRFDTLERLSTLRAAQNFKVGGMSPQEAYRSIVQPGRFEHLEYVRQNLPTERWEELRGAFKDELLRNPDALRTELGKFDDRTLGLLLSERERAEVGRIADTLDSIRASGIEDALIRQNDGARLALDLMATNSTAQVDELVKLAGGKNTPLGKSFRAGILDALYQKNVVTEGGRTFINAKALRRSLDELSQNGSLNKFLAPFDRERLLDLATYLEGVQKRGDFGSSLQAAETTAGVFDMKASALMNLLDQYTIGRVMTTPGMQRFFYGTKTGERWSPKSLRLLGAALTDLSTDIGGPTAADSRNPPPR